MENFRSQIDLFLTEVSIELLGNKLYDINGKRQDKLINLFKALPEKHRDNQGDSEESNENTNDFLCSLGYQSDFSDNETSVKEFLDEQLDFILEDANKTPAVNHDVIKTLRDYKADQKRLVIDVSELNIKSAVEKQYKIKSSLNKSRSKILNQNLQKKHNEKADAILKYYAAEKNELLKMSMDTLRLMKYIINDPLNTSVQGELIGYVHAMRSAMKRVTINDHSKDHRNFPGTKTKPYRLSKER